MINIIKYYFSSTKDIKPLVIFYCCISVIVYIIPALFPQLESYLIDSITQIQMNKQSSENKTRVRKTMDLGGNKNNRNR